MLIPAHNEEKVIAGTVRHILASDYPNLEVIVIDDGSKDGTRSWYDSLGADPRVRLIAIPMPARLPRSIVVLREARGRSSWRSMPTRISRRTIRNLVRWFPTTASAPSPAMPRWATGSTLSPAGRRSNTSPARTSNAGPWRAGLHHGGARRGRRLAARGVGALGGFPADTLAEDQDLTIALLRAGYRVLYDSQAIAWTEAPDTVSGLIKQRFRWAFGTLQCLWKHRKVTLKPRYGSLGLIAVPQTWLFQFLFSVVAPFVDLTLIWRLAMSGVDLLQHQDQSDGGTLEKSCSIISRFSSSISVVPPLRSAWSGGKVTLLPWLVLQRFGYRQLMYYIVIKAPSSLLGPLVGWGKLERKSTVTELA